MSRDAPLDFNDFDRIAQERVELVDKVKALLTDLSDLTANHARRPRLEEIVPDLSDVDKCCYAKVVVHAEVTGRLDALMQLQKAPLQTRITKVRCGVMWCLRG